MKKLHPDVENYVKLMRMLAFWFGEDDNESKSLFASFLQFNLKFKWAASLCIFVFSSISLYFNDSYGLYDGTITYIPWTFLTATFANVASRWREEHHILTNSLSDHYYSHGQPWMVSVRNEINKPTYKWGKIIIAVQALNLFMYVVLPLLVEIVFHHVFDALEGHILFPLPFSTVYKLLNVESVWDAKFYMLTIVNCYAAVEMSSVLWGFHCSYGFLTMFFIAEIRTFKEAIKTIDSTLPEIERDRKIGEMVEWYCSILKLNKIIKAYFGLPCAFFTVFAPLQLSLSSFSVATNPNLAVLIPHCFAVYVTIVVAFFFNVLGQKIENESDEIYIALNNWPWYQWSPRERKTINMMIRQAQSPLTIDYHGKAKLNNDNLMQMLEKAYSYFTLLYSLAAS